MSKATDYKNKYAAEKYDRVGLMLPKGQKDVIKAHISKSGESLNGFIVRAIDETMQRDLSAPETPTSEIMPAPAPIKQEKPKETAVNRSPLLINASSKSMSTAELLKLARRPKSIALEDGTAPDGEDGQGAGQEG